MKEVKLMPDREKVMLGIEACANGDIMMQCSVCPYYEIHQRCVTTMMRDALALLKEQEPRVMTLGEARDVLHAGDFIVNEDRNGRVLLAARGEFDFRFPATGEYTDFDALDDDDNDAKEKYGKVFRFWTSRPTEEQRKAAKWND